MTDALRAALHAITGGLENPAIILLIAVIALMGVLVGETVVEFFLTRSRRRIDLPKLVLDLGRAEDEAAKAALLADLPFSRTQRCEFDRVLDAPEDTSAETLRALAVQSLMDADLRVDKQLYVTKVVSRLAPMLGLMATLIPLGPGLQALGNGDPKGLSSAMLMAFDATVVGLASAIISFLIFELKKTWYKADLNALELVLDEVTR